MSDVTPNSVVRLGGGSSNRVVVTFDGPVAFDDTWPSGMKNVISYQMTVNSVATQGTCGGNCTYDRSTGTFTFLCNPTYFSVLLVVDFAG